MAKPSNKKNNKDFAPSFGFWPAKSGKGYTVFIDEVLLATLTKAQEGGRLYLAEVPEEKREENEKMPTYRVTIFPPSEQEAGASEGV